MPEKDSKEINIGDVYPDLNAEEQREAEENLVQYLRVVRAIFDRLSEANPNFLTELKSRASVTGRERPPK